MPADRAPLVLATADIAPALMPPELAALFPPDCVCMASHFDGVCVCVCVCVCVRGCVMCLCAYMRTCVRAYVRVRVRVHVYVVLPVTHALTLVTETQRRAFFASLEHDIRAPPAPPPAPPPPLPPAPRAPAQSAKETAMSEQQMVRAAAFLCV
jgi:hypothetical protein